MADRGPSNRGLLGALDLLVQWEREAKGSRAEGAGGGPFSAEYRSRLHHRSFSRRAK